MSEQKIKEKNIKGVTIGEIIIWIIFFVFLFVHILNSSLRYLPFGFIFLLGFLLLSKRLLKRTKLKPTIIYKEKIWWYYLKNTLLAFITFFLIFFHILSIWLTGKCLCLIPARNIFTHQCKIFSGSPPWYYKQDSSCFKWPSEE
jgi:hypothetical protein